jgi:TrkA domain protein
MAEVIETKLPGIGVRYDFRTASGTPVGVLVHRSGRRDLLVYSKKDSAATELTLGLDADDSRTLAELLGASREPEPRSSREASFPS